MSEQNDDFLVFRNVSKSYGGVNALKNISLSIKKGEIHAIVGENGAGKSTLIKICGGIIVQDSGEVLFQGRHLDNTNPFKVKNCGISIVNQELALCPDLTVVSNVFLSPKPPSKLGMLNFKKMRSIVDDLFTRLDLEIDIDETLKNLPISQQQLIEIAKSIYGSPSLIIMDEPTSSLNMKETKVLFKVIKKLNKEGITIIYISHRLEEVFELADRITVLRDGMCIGTEKKESVRPDEIVRMMVGTKIKDFLLEIKPTEKTEKVIEGVNLVKGNILKDVNFSLYRSEVLGLAGLQGSGNSELLRLLFGLGKIDSGDIIIGGKKVIINSPQDAISKGIGYIPADRRIEGLVLDKSIYDNFAYTNLNRISKFGMVDNKILKELCGDYAKKININMSSIYDDALNLSGGNQQKLVIGKILATRPRVILMDDPTRGIDVGAKAEIHKLLSQLISDGNSIMLVSSELPELLSMSTRLIVFYKGRIVAELQKDEIEEEKVMTYSTGAFMAEKALIK